MCNAQSCFPVDYVTEMTAKNSSEFSKYESFAHFLIFFFLVTLIVILRVFFFFFFFFFGGGDVGCGGEMVDVDR